MVDETYHAKHAMGLMKLQPTYGTAVTPDVDIGLIQTVTPSAKNSLQTIYAIGSRLIQQIIAGNYEGNLDIDMFYQHGRIFELLCGTTVVHAETTTDWKHTFIDGSGSPATPGVSGKTFSYSDGVNSTADVLYIYEGCNIGTLTLSLDLGGVLSVKMSCPFRDQANSTTAPAAIISTIPVFPAFFATISRGTEGSETAQVRVQSFEVTFEVPLVGVWGIGDRIKGDELEEGFNIRYRYSLAFRSKVEQERFQGGASPLPTATPAAFGVVLNMNNGVTLGSGRHEINVELRGVHDEDWNNSVTFGNVILQEYSGLARQLYKLDTVDNISSSAWS